MIFNFDLYGAANESGMTTEAILDFVNFEWIKPVDPINLIFDNEDIHRIQLISELKKDFGVNDESIPIILYLIDQLNHLHLNTLIY